MDNEDSHKINLAIIEMQGMEIKRLRAELNGLAKPNTTNGDAERALDRLSNEMNGVEVDIIRTAPQSTRKPTADTIAVPREVLLGVREALNILKAHDAFRFADDAIDSLDAVLEQIK